MFSICLAGAALVSAAASVRAQPATASVAPPVIEVGGQTVSMPAFEAAVREAMRQKFYHGKVPEAQVQALTREVADKIVDDVLLLAEASRRGIKPDPKKMQKVASSYDERYGGTPGWKQNREQMLARLMPEIERRDMLDQLEQAVRNVPAPTPAEVRTFYETKKDLFTEPEKLRMSLILLRVDPSAGRTVWDKAMEEGTAIYKRLQAGADFAEAARLHSSDESAARGGELGYLHRGMLPEELQVKVDSFKTGEVQPPIRTLHGVAIMRLDEKVAPKLRGFDEVKSRAEELLKRERGDAAWKALVAKLRSQGKFVVREGQIAELAARLR